MTSLIISLDKTLTLFSQRLLPQNPFFDLLFSFFSFQGIHIFVWIVILILIIIFEERKNPGLSQRDKKFIVYFVLSLLTTAFLVNVILKNFFNRLRPTVVNIYQARANFCPTDFSFPSGHASLSFAAATILAVFDKKRKSLYYFIALLVAYSRLYLGCHYFVDVIAGGVIGYFISKIILSLNKIQPPRLDRL